VATITIPGMFLFGSHASLPAVGDVGIGTLYACTDHSKVYQSDGTTWNDWFNAGTAGGDIAAHLADTDDAHDASAVSIVDAGAHFTGTEVEAALQELAAALAGITGLTAGITFVFNGGGSEIADGQQLDIPIPFDCDIDSVTMLADQSGDAVVDIWKDSYANFPPTDADSITAAALPTITAATKSEDSTLTGWTTALSAGDILRANVDSCTTITRLTVFLQVTRT